ACAKETADSYLMFVAVRHASLRRGGLNSQKARNRLPSFSDAPTRAYQQRSFSTKAWAISSSSALPETSSRPLKSAAWNLLQNGSAHRSLWCWVTRDAELFLPRWKSS